LITLISLLPLAGIHILSSVLWIFAGLRVVSVIAVDDFVLVAMA
jgi:hypothetical protein